MRVCLLVPLCALFGCAHEAASTTAENQPAAQPSEHLMSQTNTASETAKATEDATGKAAIAEAKGDVGDKGQIACAPVKVHFALDSDVLYDSEKPLLDTAAKCLSENDRQKVTIVGNADERGSESYNMDLGQRRADAVAQYLQSKGADSTQVEAIVSHGEDSPICAESTLQCWQLNRRTAVRESCHM